MDGDGLMVLLLILCTFATAAMSLTLTKSKITKPLRDWVQVRSAWWGELVSCFYCISHWIAFVLSTFIFNHLWLIIVGTFAMVAGSAIVGGVIIKLLLWHESEIEHLKQQLEEPE